MVRISTSFSRLQPFYSINLVLPVMILSVIMLLVYVYAVGIFAAYRCRRKSEFFLSIDISDHF